jgi:Na+-translocating ferredoxin:NAD+ oxidoreductase RNF subunit RnfB
MNNIPYCMQWNEDLEYAPVMKLSDDISEAMAMMMEIDDICSEFPGMDCGSCGAPSCRALAEDVVKGEAKKSDCIFVLRDEIQRMAATLAGMSHSQFPSSFSFRTEEGDGDEA